MRGRRNDRDKFDDGDGSVGDGSSDDAGGKEMKGEMKIEPPRLLSLEMRGYKFPYAPKWVNWVYRVAEWVDYSVVGNVSSFLQRRYGLVDKWCVCERCLERRRNGR